MPTPDAPTPLSPHFTFEELTDSDGHPSLVPANRADAIRLRVVPALRALAALLEDVRAACGDRPIAVHSGFRSATLNAVIGGSPTSQHLRGEAADFHVPGLDLEAAFAAIRQDPKVAGRWGQLILEGSRPGRPSWIHISLGAPWRTSVGEVLVYDGSGYRRLT